MRKRLLIATGCLAALLLSFAAGRWTSPRPVREETVAKTEARRDTKAAETTQATSASSSAAASSTTSSTAATGTKRRREFNCPDGRLSAEEETTTGVQSATKTDVAAKTETAATVQESRKVETHEEAKAETHTVTEYRPAWSADLGLGYAFRGPWLDLGAPRVALDLTVTRHIAGPVRGGVRASSMGALFVVAGVEW